MVEEGQLSFIWSWDTELEKQDQAGYRGEGDESWNQTDMRSTEKRVKGEQCRDLGGQPKPWQVPGMMNDHTPAENRLV